MKKNILPVKENPSWACCSIHTNFKWSSQFTQWIRTRFRAVWFTV